MSDPSVEAAAANVCDDVAARKGKEDDERLGWELMCVMMMGAGDPGRCTLQALLPAPSGALLDQQEEEEAEEDVWFDWFVCMGPLEETTCPGWFMRSSLR